jgi:cell division protein FtsZ
VATGIDNTGVASQIQSAERALTELAGRLRNDSRRIADPVEPRETQPQIEHPPLRPVARLFARPTALVSKYARQAYGPSSAVPTSIEEEVLDIPAFLPARPTEPSLEAEVTRFKAA